MVETMHYVSRFSQWQKDDDIKKQAKTTKGSTSLPNLYKVRTRQHNLKYGNLIVRHHNFLPAFLQFLLLLIINLYGVDYMVK